MSRSNSSPSGASKVADGDVPDVALVHEPVAEVAKRCRRRRHAGLATASAQRWLVSSTTNRCGARDFAASQRRVDQLAEQRVRPVGAALELGMGLRADPERVVVELDELDQAAVGRDPAAAQPGGLELRLRAGR